MGLCDIHCHLLPDIDDGRVGVGGFREMMELYRESGFTTIAFTPHIYNPYVESKVQDLRSVYRWASDIAGEVGIHTYLGSELFIGTQEVLKSLPIAGHYALVESSLNLPPALLVERIDRLAATGLTPIIAHIERYKWMDPECGILSRLLDIGVLVQVNAAAVEDGRALPYLEADLVDIIASDNHGDATLPGRLAGVLNAWPSVHERMDRLGL